MISKKNVLMQIDSFSLEKDLNQFTLLSGKFKMSFTLDKTEGMLPLDLSGITVKASKGMYLSELSSSCSNDYSTRYTRYKPLDSSTNASLRAIFSKNTLITSDNLLFGFKVIKEDSLVLIAFFLPKHLRKLKSKEKQPEISILSKKRVHFKLQKAINTYFALNPAPSECLMCLDNSAQVRFKPCNHKIYCLPCFERLSSRQVISKCDYCSANIVYLPVNTVILSQLVF